MNRPPLTSTTMQPGFRDFLAKLYIDTRVDPLMFAEWIRANLACLRAQFYLSDEPEDQMGAWLRLQFMNRVKPIPTKEIHPWMKPYPNS